jgi:hypothetical protein
MSATGEIAMLFRALIAAAFLFVVSAAAGTFDSAASVAPAAQTASTNSLIWD